MEWSKWSEMGMREVRAFSTYEEGPFGDRISTPRADPCRSKNGMEWNENYVSIFKDQLRIRIPILAPSHASHNRVTQGLAEPFAAKNGITLKPSDKEACREGWPCPICSTEPRGHRDSIRRPPDCYSEGIRRKQEVRIFDHGYEVWTTGRQESVNRQLILLIAIIVLAGTSNSGQVSLVRASTKISYFISFHILYFISFHIYFISFYSFLPDVAEANQLDVQSRFTSVYASRQLYKLHFPLMHLYLSSLRSRHPD